MVAPRVFVLRVPTLSPGYSDVVLAAALTLLVEGESLALCPEDVDDLTPAHAELLMARIADLGLGDVIAPTVSLVDRAEADAMVGAVQSVVLDGPAGAASGVIDVVSFVQHRDRDRARVSEAHEVRNALVARRNAVREPSESGRPVIAVVAQVLSTWPAFEPVFRELAAGAEVELVVVYVPSEHEMASTDGRQYFIDLGATVRDVTWLKEQLEDFESPLAGVVFYDPWDGLRPQSARAFDVAQAGVPVFYFPYANSLGVGAGAEQMTYNMPVHQIASAVFVVNDAQRAMFAEYCAAGADDVRVTGSPKMDRMLPLRRDTPGQVARTFLWNPHFQVGDGGWSTILDYYEPLVEYFETHPDLTLIIRPHFRIVRDFPLLGGEFERCWSRLSGLAATNIEIDRSPDYLESFSRSDALLSDFSSLVTEYIQTDKPILRLGNGHKVPLNADAAFFEDIDSADSWIEVRRFLDEVALDASAHAERVRSARLAHFAQQDGFAAQRAAAVVLGAVGAPPLGAGAGSR